MLFEPEICYRAAQGRAISRFDGRFFVGVSCNHRYLLLAFTCTVKTPKAENCTYFSCAAACA